MQHQRLCRELQLSTGTVQLHPVARDETFQVDGETLRAPFGPGWRILGMAPASYANWTAIKALSPCSDCQRCRKSK